MKMEIYMKGLADRIGYKTLKAQFYDELEKSKTAKAEDDDQNKDTSEVEIDSCNTEEIRLREKVKWLEAELNIKEKQDSKKNDKLKLLRKSVLTNLEETVSKPTFEQELSRLVTQLSFALDEEQIVYKEDGSVIINKDIFKELESKIEQLDAESEEKQIATSNLSIFRKALEKRIQVIPTADGSRRLSFGGLSTTSNSSLKRKSEVDHLSRKSKLHVSNLQKPTVGKGKNGTSRRLSHVTMDLAQFQTSGDNPPLK